MKITLLGCLFFVAHGVSGAASVSDKIQWKGLVDRFEFVDSLNSFCLLDSTANHSAVYTEQKFTSNFACEFTVSLNFSPSSNNCFEVLFWGDSNVLEFATNAIYAKLGESGGQDAFDVYVKTGGKNTLICSLAAGKLSSNNNRFVVRFQKSGTIISIYLAAGQQLFFHSFNEDKFNQGGSIDGFFMIDLTYTKSNAAGVCVENILLNAEQRKLGMRDQHYDVNTGVFKFKLNHFLLPGDTLLLIGDNGKNEKLDVFLDSGQVILKGLDKGWDSVRFLLRNAVGDEQFLMVDVFNYSLSYGDLIFTELMMEPKGPTGWFNYTSDDCSYIEIYNSTEHQLKVSNLVLKVNGKEVFLPSFIIQPAAYVVFAEKINAYKNGKVIEGWPVFNKSKNRLSLWHQENLIADLEWDKNSLPKSFKDQGGWSTGLCELSSACMGFKAWGYSDSKQGGTPGIENVGECALYEELITEVYFVDDSTIDVSSTGFFNSVGVPCFQIEGGLQVSQVTRISGFSYRLTLNQEMKKGEVYRLKTCMELSKCAQSELSLKFGKSFVPITGTLLINEILSNPEEGVSAYVELYNHNEVPLLLSAMSLGEYDADGVLEALIPITEKGIMLFPAQYVCVCRECKSVKYRYQAADSVRFIELNSTIGLLKDEGVVSVWNKFGDEVDKVSYAADWQSEYLVDVKGVALERNLFNAPSQNESNWTSASFSAGYGTPGAVNSVVDFLEGEKLKEFFQFETNVLSRVEKELIVKYHLPADGYVCTLTVFDADGVEKGVVFSSKVLSKRGGFRVSLDDFVLRSLVAGNYIFRINAVHELEKPHVGFNNVSILD